MTCKRMLATTICLGAAIALALSAPPPSFGQSLSPKPQIALTFDDAPQTAPLLLHTLAQKDAKATFFIEGVFAEAHPEQARAIVSAGMLVGNHSYEHPNFAGATAEEVHDDLSHAQSVITSITGVTPRWYRSPYLAWNDAYVAVLPQLGLRISWPTINPKDWAGTPPQDIIDLVREQEAPGGVVELHDMFDQTNTIEALPGLIDGLYEDGYELVTLDDIGFGAIEGSVSTSEGSALSGVVATAYDTNGDAVGTASTDADGSYRIAGLDAGRYRVVFSADGYVSSCYDGASDLAHATPIAVAVDYAITGADATLIPVDRTPPVTTIRLNSSGEWVNHDVAFELSAYDARSADGMVTYYEFGFAGVVTPYSNEITVSREGTTDIAYWSVDGSGNTESRNRAWVRIDKTPPRTRCDARGAYGERAIVRLTPRDSESGVVDTHYSIDGGEMTSGTVVCCSTAGRHRLEYGSVDAAGNDEQTRVATFTVTYSTSLSAAAQQGAPRYRGPVRVRATLRGSSASRKPLRGQPIRLQVRATGGWRDLAVARTGSGGSAAFVVRPGSKTTYRVRYAGVSDVYDEAVSAPFSVIPKVSLAWPVAPKRVKRRKAFTVSGSLRPRHGRGTKHVRVYVYKRVHSRWKRYGYVRARVGDFRYYSRYWARLRLHSGGRWRLRAYFLADSNHAATWSSYRYLTVR